MATGAKMTGQDRVAARLRRMAQRYEGDRIAGALYRRGEFIMADSKENHVPVDLGTLRGSGTVHPPKRSGREVSVEMTYGGAAKDYAIAVHEHPSKHSPPSWRGKGVSFSPAGHGAKYLEKPLMAAVRTMPQDLARDLAFEDEG